MKKFLINVNFNFYKEGNISSMPNYVLIIEFDGNFCGQTQTVQYLIRLKLIELGFILPEINDPQFRMSFTTQRL